MTERNAATLLAGLLLLGVLSFSRDVKPPANAGGDPTSTNNLRGRMPSSFDRDVEAVVANLDRIEAETLRNMEKSTLDREGQVRALGKLLLFDKHLSVNQNEACSFCHTPETGFTGPIQALNLSTVSYPGSVRTRFSQRKPQSYMYATFAQCCITTRYKATSSEEISGICAPAVIVCKVRALNRPKGHRRIPWKWVCRTRPVIAYRLSKAPYRKLFEAVWGRRLVRHSTGPRDVEKVCATPGPPPAEDPYPVHLSVADRHVPTAIYDGFGLAAAAYEASPEVSPFTSKYDYVQAGQGPDSRRRKPRVCAVPRQGEDAISVTAMAAR